MNTETLIRELARQGLPVKPVEPPAIRFVRWLIVAAISTAAGVALVAPRADLTIVSLDPVFILRAALTLGLALISALAAFVLTVPGKKAVWFSVIPLWALVALYILIAYSVLSADTVDTGPGLKCIERILGLALLPGSLLYFMLRKAAPLNVAAVGLLAAMSAAALGTLGSQFLCQRDDPLHILVWHFLPVLGIGGIGTLIGRLLFRWDRRLRQ